MVAAADPPPIKPPFKRPASQPSLEDALRAINTVKEALPFIEAGPPLVHRGPRGEIHVDCPLMYQSFALDRVHFDVASGKPSPKGKPSLAEPVDVDLGDVRRAMAVLIKELWVVEAAEFREPEDAWVVPLAWKVFIVAHVKVSRDGGELIPDYPLTEEVMKHAL